MARFQTYSQIMDLNKLSAKDLALLLAELEQEDESLAADVAKIEQSIVKEEALDFVDATEEDPSDTSDITAKLKEYGKVKDKEAHTRYKIKIQRLAVNQNLLKLSDQIPNYDLQALARIVAEKQVTIAERARASANMRLKRLLNSLIPISIRRLYNTYPWVVKRCPGFVYDIVYIGRTAGSKKGTDMNGPRILFWATPNVPYFFRQGTEQNILLKYRPEMVYLVDNAVNMYYKYQNAQEAKALGVATRIIKNNVKTYFDLLMYNPRWFELLYNLAKNE